MYKSCTQMTLIISMCIYCGQILKEEKSNVSAFLSFQEDILFMALKYETSLSLFDSSSHLIMLHMLF